MKVILRTEIENLGNFGDQVKVARGYARNYLIPKGFALEATPGNLRQFDAEKEAWLKREAAKKERAEKLGRDIEGLSLTFTRKTAEEEKLFGSVTIHDIAEELKAKGFEVEKKGILLPEPFKTTGEFTVPVRLHPEVIVDLKVEIQKETKES